MSEQTTVVEFDPVAKRDRAIDMLVMFICEMARQNQSWDLILAKDVIEPLLDRFTQDLEERASIVDEVI